ncbi:unnamed protein product [Vitrella brassicaformis CCMP3155]|uniref:SOCS box domain-containing protein n=2 Tax=Vitrella brassicaformis TaxID=1169539 RepID=A0A0G4F382_VITBC|nr:unnamed protein product [Vitrella brassicaformis CCMP3155]|mmetsp:Transcript_9080/g.22275  ORF Transcript_9080/g.22275 Transcript_9080/m.22275 type:complete len:235 (+) Transcript_9080:132-836(+)|eukprot:CEM06374.1 unnamed protein product [Vitrella brassicaformis CCMP3155]
MSAIWWALSAAFSYLLGAFVIVGLIAGGLYWYGCFLDKADIDDIKRVLTYLVWVLCAVEVTMWLLGFTSGFYILLALVTNVWGFLDGIHRYPKPIVRDPVNLFVGKVTLLSVAKALTFVFGFRYRTSLWFLWWFFLNVWTLPLFFVMSLPFGDKRLSHAPMDTVDKDMLVQLYEAVIIPVHRRKLIVTLQHHTDMCIVSALRICPALDSLLAPLPTTTRDYYRQLLRKSAIRPV